jgi:hypothetical protein
MGYNNFVVLIPCLWLLVSSTSETNENDESIVLASDRFDDIDNNTIADDHDDLFHNALHQKKGNAHNVFFINTTPCWSFLPIKHFQRTTYSKFSNTK